MAAQTTESRRGRFEGRLRAWKVLLLLMLAATMLLAPGCGGCRKQPEKTDEEKKKEEEERLAKSKEKEKPPFEFRNLLSQPNEGRSERFYCKPGHWTAYSLAAKANDGDVDGELETTVTNSNGNPISLEAMAYTISTSRASVLPKREPRTLEGMVFVPSAVQGTWAKCLLSDRRTGRSLYEYSNGIVSMPPHQYHFVVLARLPGGYNYLDKDLACFKNPEDLKMIASGQDSANRNFYRVVSLPGDQPMLLPAHALYWTSIACILWDDAQPESLRQEQQAAMVDWLHWGGQLIISGPDSLDGLRNSFLQRYLPATYTGERKLNAVDLKPLNEYWKAGGKSAVPLVPADAWRAVKWEKHPDAQFLPGTADLVVERRVGRGRIVVTAFPLTRRELVAWKGFDGFFNGCLLGHPPRKFHDTGIAMKMFWADGSQPATAADARQTCKLRYFSRDTDRQSVNPAGRTDEGVLGPGLQIRFGPGDYPTEPQVQLPDVGSWDDYNGVARAARESLQNAARIEVPDAKFVLWVLGIYLLVLVPLNWIVFRVVGRVEWAWAAAPVIAVVCTVVVIKLANLEIGFARSSTEIAVVEMQGDHPRAHVARYTALYTSLFTRYQVSSEDPGAQVQPFPTAKSPHEFQRMLGQVDTRLRLRQGPEEAALQGFTVSSNSTSFLHSEQMIDVGGGLVLTQATGGDLFVANRTNYALQGVGILRKSENRDNLVEAAWIGTLESGATAPVRFQPVSDKLWETERGLAVETTQRPPQGELNVRALTELAQKVSELERGEVRLIGWMKEGVPGIAIEPKTRQERQIALVVAHLRHGPRNAPRPDVNTMEEAEHAPIGTGTVEEMNYRQ